MPAHVEVRDYHERDIARLREAMRRTRRVVYVLPTGGGKTWATARMVATAAGRGFRVYFLMHRQELLTQASGAFEAVGVPHGRIEAGEPVTGEAVQVASVQTLVNRLHQVPPPDLLVIDECHHAAAATWRKLIDAWPDVRMLGLTATPARLDGRGLDDVFDELVCGPGVRELIDRGYLADYRLYAPPQQAELQGVRKRGGDYQRGQLAAAMDTKSVTGDAVEHHRRLAAGRRTLVFCVSVQHSEHVTEAYRAAGYAAAHLDGKTNPIRRRELVQAFANGELDILSNVDLFGEGFDVPGVEAVQLLRPTQSLALYLQMVGRALRPAPGKDHALILDHAGAALQHGLPDAPREWTLQGRKRAAGTAGESEPQVRQCPVCFACHSPRPTCPDCGHVYESQAREVSTQDGELIELTESERKRREQEERRREVAACQSKRELIELAKQRGYRNPTAWATHVLASRQRKGRGRKRGRAA